MFHGSSRVLQTTPQANGGFSYFPGTDGLFMWREAFGVDTGGVLVAQIEDLHQQGRIFFPTPADNTKRPFGLWNGCSLTSYPNATFDRNNVLYLTYSSIVDSLLSIVNAEKLVRQVFIIKSNDGGVNWSNPCNLVGIQNGIDNYEAMFPSIAKNVDGNVHIVYQRDLGPGGVLPNGTTPSPDYDDNVGQSNDYVYVKIPTNEVGGCGNIITSNKVVVLNAIEYASFYPNPASTNATLSLNLSQNKKVTVSIVNSIGQTVYSISFEGTIGTNKSDINVSALTNGLYFYKITTSNKTPISGKFVIEK